MGSKKLKKAMLAQSVLVRNRTSAEVHIWYRGRDGRRRTATLQTLATLELAPKLTDAVMLEFSNLDELARRGLIEIM